MTKSSNSNEYRYNWLLTGDGKIVAADNTVYNVKVQVDMRKSTLSTSTTYVGFYNLEIDNQLRFGLSDYDIRVIQNTRDTHYSINRDVK